jgi:hypothetical protein
LHHTKNTQAVLDRTAEDGCPPTWTLLVAALFPKHALEIDTMETMSESKPFRLTESVKAAG